MNKLTRDSPKEKCPFCSNTELTQFHEHYYFCPECTSIYTYMLIRNIACNHIKDDTPTVIRKSWFIGDKLNNVIFITEDKRCSICGAEAQSDGW